MTITNGTAQDELAQERQARLADIAEGKEAGWEAGYRPGSFGCHELLDRLALVNELLDRRILDHPACVLNEEWFRQASGAVEALCNLYQRVGAEHIPAIDEGAE